VIDICRQRSIKIFLPDSEIEKYSLDPPGEGVTALASLKGSQPDICLALGGDGTILRAFNHFPGMQVPVFGVNFGRVGFLSAVEPSGIDSGINSVLAGEYETFELSLVELDLRGEKFLAFNDVVVHKPDGGSIIRLGYSIAGVDLASMSCDGLVVATAAGSTAYNLATGGPLISLRLDAMVVTAIAPHSLCSRPLVTAPGDQVTIRNESISAVASVYVDGRSCGDLAPGSSIDAAISPLKARLLQLPGANFYQKLRDKFIRPARGSEG